MGQSGQATTNSNFQPVVGDWRDKIRQAKVNQAKLASDELGSGGVEKATTAPSKAKKSGHLNFKFKPDLDVLSKGLPSVWFRPITRYRSWILIDILTIKSFVSSLFAPFGCERYRAGEQCGILTLAMSTMATSLPEKRAGSGQARGLGLLKRHVLRTGVVLLYFYDRETTRCLS